MSAHYIKMPEGVVEQLDQDAMATLSLGLFKMFPNKGDLVKIDDKDGNELIGTVSDVAVVVNWTQS